MIEDLAEYVHSAWAGWMKYIFEKSERNDDGSSCRNSPAALSSKDEKLRPIDTPLTS